MTQHDSADETTHIDYLYHASDWRKIRDAVAGERRIHEAGELYLPRLSSRRDPAADARYYAYRDRARFLGLAARTLAGWVGSLFRKEPTIDAPGLEDLLADVDLAGTTMAAFSRRAARETLETGRAGVLVDHQTAPGGRPYLLLYRADEILDWEESVSDGVRYLSRVVLARRPHYRAWAQGTTSSARPDPYSGIEEYRVLRLVDGVYHQERHEYIKTGDKARWVMTADVVPLVRGLPMSRLPFVFLSPAEEAGHLGEICPSPLLPIVEINLHHYKRSADLCHALHFVALPTPWVSGHQSSEGDPPLEYGSGVMLEFNSGAQVGMLEVTGAGIGALRSDCEDLKAEAAALGASYLTPPKREAETAEALNIKHAEASSPLATTASALSASLTRALEIVAEWVGADPSGVAVQISKDFDRTTLDPAALSSLVSALQSGAITPEIFASQLYASEMLPPGKTAADYAQEISSASGSLDPAPISQ